MTAPSTRKSLGIFSLTCCEGCQFEMLNHYEEFGSILDFYEIKNFRLGSDDNLPEPFDVAIIEGNPEGERQIKFLKNIRNHSKIIIAIGACAHLGGIQSERNRLSRKLINKESIKSVPETIKVDYIVPGCPIDHEELYKCLMDVYWGKIFALPDLAVCFECRQNENKCLIKEEKPCLGPISRAGCNSICVNNGEACLGCRGTIPQPNVLKLKEVLGKIISEKEINNMLSIYGQLDK